MCQRTRHPFFCFTLLLRCSLTCSGTSASTSQLTVTPFLYHAKQRRGSSAIPECSEEDESWLGANWKQMRAGVTSFCYFPNLWQIFLVVAWLVWFAVLAGALILFLLWSGSREDGVFPYMTLLCKEAELHDWHWFSLIMLEFPESWRAEALGYSWKFYLL